MSNNLKISFRTDVSEEIRKRQITDKVEEILGKDSVSFSEIKDTVKNLGETDIKAEELIDAVALAVKEKNKEKGIDSNVLEGLAVYLIKAKEVNGDISNKLQEIEHLEKMAKNGDVTKDHELSIEEVQRQVAILSKELGSNNAVAVVPKEALGEIYEGAPIEEVADNNIKISQDPEPTTNAQTLANSTPTPYQTLGEQKLAQEAEFKRREEEIKQEEMKQAVENEKEITARSDRGYRGP